MKNDPTQPDDPDRTQPVEVQRYGPAVQRDPAETSWQAAPAWSTRPPEPPQPVQAKRGLSAGPIIAIAIVAGLLSGALSAFGVATLLDNGPNGAVADNGSTDANTVSDVTIDEQSAVIQAADRVAPAVVLCAVKLLFAPAVALLCVRVFGVPEPFATVAVLQAAMPSALATVIIVGLTGCDRPLAAAVCTLASLASMATLPAVAWFVEASR